MTMGAGDLNSGPNARQALDQLGLAPAEPWETPGGVQLHLHYSGGRVGGAQVWELGWAVHVIRPGVWVQAGLWFLSSWSGAGRRASG